MGSSSAGISRRGLLTAAGVAGAAAAGGVLRAAVAEATVGPSSYTATWPSVDQHPPAAEWFQDAKFGIYYHWGAFSVPAFGNEWYPRNMYNNGSAENNHHKSAYGDPSTWPYHNFINGARDRAGNWVQFAPKLRSAGGNFDPDEWAQLFVDAGAKFAGPVAEHHDGFSMWNSGVNQYNSVTRGPRLDLLRLHADAIRAKGLKLLVAMHHAYNFTGFYQWAPQQSDASLRTLYGQLGTPAEYQLWYDKLREVIDGYQPDLVWQDFNLSAIPESYRLNFLAYYYNRAVAWNVHPQQGQPGAVRDRAGLAGRDAEHHHLEREPDQPELAGLGAAARPGGQHLHRPAQPRPGRQRAAGHPAVQRPLQCPGVRGEADLRRDDPDPGRRQHDGLRTDRERDHRPGARQRRQRHVRLGAQAVELGRQHQPAVAAGRPRHRYHRIVNRTNGMVVDSWGSAANGADARQAPWNGGNNQQWRLSNLGNGRYQIINRGTSTALDGMGNGTSGSTVCMWAPNNSTNNQWTIAAV